MRILAIAAASGTLIGAANAEAWRHTEVQDKFTDDVHVIAMNDVAGANERFRLSFECRDGKDFVFTIDSFHDLGGRAQPFEFRYRVDKKRARTVRMTTYTNSETGGMNKYSALRVANDMMNGENVVVRAISSSGDLYDATISLDGARAHILDAAIACGFSLKPRD